MARYIQPSPDGKEPFIGCYTLTDFAEWCREHGIPCTPDKLKAGLLAGVFQPAAWAVRSADPFPGPRRGNTPQCRTSSD